MQFARFWGLILAIYMAAAVTSLALRPDFAGLSPFRAALSVESQTADRIQHDFFGTPVAQTLYIPAHSSELTLTLNDVALSNSALTRGMHISRNHDAGVFSIPASQQQPMNRLIVTQAGELRALTPLAIYLGPSTEVAPVVRQHHALVTLVDQASRSLVIMATALLLILLFFSRKTARYFWLISSTSILILVEYKDLFHFFGRPLPVIYAYLSLIFAMSSVLCVSVWSDGNARERRIVASIAGITALILIAADLRWGLDAPETVTLRLATVMGWAIGALCFVVVRSLRFARSDNRLAVISFAMMCSYASAMALALVTLYAPVPVETKFFTYGLTNAAEVLSLLTLLFLAVIHELRQYREERRRLGQMQTIIAGHRHALDQQTEQLQTLIEQRAVIEERGRFTRDIHDGVGSRLLSLLIKARSGSLDAPGTEREITDAIADLRLMAAALDGLDETLAQALANFCHRATDQASSAGIAFRHDIDPSLHLLSIDPRSMLEALRIMQEAFANALCHAGASSIQFTASPVAEDGIRLTLKDNGCGIAKDRLAKGRGLANMQARADRLGAPLVIAPSPGGAGTAVTLTLARATISIGATRAFSQSD